MGIVDKKGWDLFSHEHEEHNKGLVFSQEYRVPKESLL